MARKTKYITIAKQTSNDRFHLLWRHRPREYIIENSTICFTMIQTIANYDTSFRPGPQDLICSIFMYPASVCNIGKCIMHVHMRACVACAYVFCILKRICVRVLHARMYLVNSGTTTTIVLKSCVANNQ